MKGNRAAGEDNASPTFRQSSPSAREATLRVLERHAAQVMRTARRYAATPEDAEDAYQRGIEIMLTKAPDIPDAELLPWLKTVVRHEAFALRRREARIALDARSDGDLLSDDDFVSLAPTPVEQVERFERLRLGAEALQGLKPQEARALTLLAQGYSYSQICEKTGWSYTKVNRCLAEGRQSFIERVRGIESGAECDRLATRLSAFADGEAPADDVLVVRRHLRGCLACKARLRDIQLVPAAVGALAPLPLSDQLAWWAHRLTELATAIRVKCTSAVRTSPVDWGSSGSHLSLEGGAREVVASGVVKVLAILCVGGAGGAAMIERAFDPVVADSAQAAVDTADPAIDRLPPLSSPSPELVAERLRQPTAPQGSEAGPRGLAAAGARGHRRTDQKPRSVSTPPSPLQSSVRVAGPDEGGHQGDTADQNEGARPSDTSHANQKAGGNSYDDPYVDPTEHEDYDDPYVDPTEHEDYDNPYVDPTEHEDYDNPYVDPTEHEDYDNPDVEPTTGH